ncbi:MAG: hypothetical protein WEB58_18295 [Planctomycetaceae bacterium]
MPDQEMPLSVCTETYPIMLLKDAIYLVKEAEAGRAKRADNREIPSPMERAAARAAIFTAFNLLEGLLIELTQKRISNGPTKCSHCNETILEELKSARASVSRTITEWPLTVLGVCIAGMAEFGKFKEIRILRNHLIHPKLETQANSERTQDDLLKECNSQRCKQVLYEIVRMCNVLYTVYGQSVPQEFCNVLNDMKP